MKLLGIFGIVLFLPSLASASAPLTIVRWTGSDDANAAIIHVIDLLNQKTGFSLTEQDFLLEEDRDLAFTHYQRFEQVVAGVPVDGKAIRIWTDRTTHATIQIEATVDASAPAVVAAAKAAKKSAKLSDQKAIEIARAYIMKSDDSFVRGVSVKERMVNQELSRIVTITAKHGKHRIAVSERTLKIIDSHYDSFPESDVVSYPANVYPIDEFSAEDGSVQARTPVTLKYIYKQIPAVSGDIYASLKQTHYYDRNFSTVLASTAAGQAQGFWSMTEIKEKASAVRASLALADNSFQNGLLLQGQYATINIYPDAFTKFPGVTIPKVSSSAFFPDWVDTTFQGNPATEMVPDTAFAGKPLLSAQEILDRPARILPNNDPPTYLNDGFDEIQVYYAINTLMEELQQRGFTDPDLSTRPFNAFLYNPDIASQNNAFYTDDTINFNTYSPGADNAARDNSTIWHELGHGIMDRLMGDNITLADTGGLSEGMADFVAAMIIQSVTQGTPFPGYRSYRIINKTGFFLTNEVHDDGEAYGGTMKDFLDAAVARDGQAGLAKVVDVILETMRLTRDHPGLTAKIWFEHILFADALGHTGVRAPGELAPLLISAINGRNFKLDGSQTAAFTLTNVTNQQEVLSGAPGSRQRPIALTLPLTGTKHFDLSVNLKSSDEYKFTYPVTILVKFKGGPLQGAVHWVGEEQGSKLYTIASEADTLSIPLDISGKCDSINREDGSCVDFVYVQVIDPTDPTHPHAKKRFYVRVKN